MLWVFECDNLYLWVLGVCLHTGSQMCCCLSSSEVYDPNVTVRLCVLLFSTEWRSKYIDRVEITMQQKGHFVLVTLSIHNLSKLNIFSLQYVHEGSQTCKFLLLLQCQTYAGCSLQRNNILSLPFPSQMHLPVTPFLQTNRTHKKKTKTGFITTFF